MKIKKLIVDFFAKTSLRVHTVQGLSFRLRIPLVRELFYKKNGICQ